MDTWNIKEYDILDSTNLQAGRLIETGNTAVESLHKTVLIAHEQTAGRGRRGRQWNSPGGENLYFSMILCPTLLPEETSALTLVAGLAVAESIRELTGAEALIKWPNDIVVEGKKVCGILAEMILEGTNLKAVIVGVGVNVGLREFPEELDGTAVSLEQACGKKVSPMELLQMILKCFEVYYRDYCEKRTMAGLLAPYNELLVNKDRQVQVLEPKGDYRGIARGINEKGELLVELADGAVNAVYAGEVSVRGIYGYI